MSSIKNKAGTLQFQNESGCMLRIEAYYPFLTRVEQTLARFIRKDPKRVYQSTIHRIQQESGASYATIIRFCKRLGYKGFKEFKFHLKKDVDDRKSFEKFMLISPINADDSVKQVVQKVFMNSIRTLEDSRSIVNEEGIEQTAGKILKARSVYFIGTGLSGVCAGYAYTRFFRIGIPCSAETDATIYKIKAGLTQPGDLIFAISSSGRSRTVVETAKAGRERGATVVSLCDFALSPLSKTSDIALFTTPRNATQFLKTDVQLFIAQINILDIIFFSVCAKMGAKALRALNTTRPYSETEKI